MNATTTHELIGERGRLWLWGLAGLGAVCFGAGLAVDPVRAWGNLLVNGVYFLSLAMMAGFFIAVQYLARAGWPIVLRRIPEAMLAFLPAGIVIMLLVAIGAGSIYEWAGPIQGDPILESKAGYLNVPAFTVRLVVILAIWFVLARVLVRNSLRQDETGDPAWTGRSVRFSALFIVLFALTYSIAVVDWIMSLEPHWYSTLFPWYVMSTMFVPAIALIAIFALLLRERGYLDGLNAHHLHDLGKYVFAFSVFWGYLWYSQYMLIWYANIPEETAYYIRREGGWKAVFVLNAIVNLGVPFLILPAANKQRPRVLLTVCTIVVAGHWLDVYQMVMPSLMAEGPVFGWIELGLLLGVASGFVLTFDRALRRAPIVPARDPYLGESLAHHG